jgi:hypothetical protein
MFLMFISNAYTCVGAVVRRTAQHFAPLSGNWPGFVCMKIRRRTGAGRPGAAQIMTHGPTV